MNSKVRLLKTRFGRLLKKLRTGHGRQELAERLGFGLGRPARYLLYAQVGYYGGRFDWFSGGAFAKPLGWLLRQRNLIFNESGRRSRDLQRLEGCKGQELTDRYHEFEVGAQIRNRLAELIAETNSLTMQRKYLGQEDPRLQELRTSGIVRLTELDLTDDQVNETVGRLKALPVYNGHVSATSDQIPRRLNEGARSYTFGSYPLHDSLTTPNLLELALHPRVLQLAEQYLCCAPTLYSMNTWWSFAGKVNLKTAQDFHRDMDDHRFLALFVFLTDIKGGDHGGQHEFIARTHDAEWISQELRGDERLASRFFPPYLKGFGYGQTPIYNCLFKDQIRSFTGKAGTVFLADTYALHRGVPSTKDDRLVCWIRFGLRENSAYRAAKNRPIDGKLLGDRVKPDPYLRYVTRLLVNEPSIGARDLTSPLQDMR